MYSPATSPACIKQIRGRSRPRAMVFQSPPIFTIQNSKYRLSFMNPEHYFSPVYPITSAFFRQHRLQAHYKKKEYTNTANIRANIFLCRGIVRRRLGHQKYLDNFWENMFFPVKIIARKN